MEFDFCFAIENSRSFKTVICSTNSSSHCLSRDAEHIRLTAFRWRCDEVEMRRTCLGTEKSMQRKVVINSWKLYYDTEDTCRRNIMVRNALHSLFSFLQNDRTRVLKVGSIFKTSWFSKCKYVFRTTPRLEPKTTRSSLNVVANSAIGVQRSQSENQTVCV